MIVLALKLSAANAGDTMGTAETLESQPLCRNQLTPDKVALSFRRAKGGGLKRRILYNETTDRVGERKRRRLLQLVSAE